MPATGIRFFDIQESRAPLTSVVESVAEFERRPALSGSCTTRDQPPREGIQRFMELLERLPDFVMMSIFDGLIGKAQAQECSFASLAIGFALQVAEGGGQGGGGCRGIVIVNMLIAPDDIDVASGSVCAGRGGNPIGWCFIRLAFPDETENPFRFIQCDAVVPRLQERGNYVKACLGQNGVELFIPTTAFVQGAGDDGSFPCSAKAATSFFRCGFVGLPANT